MKGKKLKTGAKNLCKVQNPKGLSWEKGLVVRVNMDSRTLDEIDNPQLFPLRIIHKEILKIGHQHDQLSQLTKTDQVTTVKHTVG